MTQENKETRTINNARRMLILMRLLEKEIVDKNLIGIAIWSDEVLNCMLHIELDNRL